MAESTRGAETPFQRAQALARDALDHAPAGLLTDFDGTLSPIVADPALARLVDGASAALGTLVERLAVVAVVTGRAPLDARRMIDTPGVLVAGNHGTEWLEADAASPTPSPDAARVRRLLDAVAARLPRLDGVVLEDKGLSISVHVRGATDPAATAELIRGRIGAVPDGLELRSGRMSLELRPIGLGDKGVATHAIVERHALRGVVVLGDDVTDLDMFRAVAELRAAGALAGAIIAVGNEDGEVPDEVVAAADVTLAGPAEAALLLAALASGGRA